MQCISPKSIGFNEFSSNIATTIVCLATNRVYNFSKMILDGMIRNVKSKGTKFLMYPRFIKKCLKMGQFGIKHTDTYPVPFHTPKVFTTLRVNNPSFSGRAVPLFDTMIVQQGKGSDNPTEPHHTPSPPNASSPQEEQPSSPQQTQPSSPPQTQTSPSLAIQPTPQVSLPQTSHTPSQTLTPRKLTRRAIRIAQSKAFTSGADEPASPPRDVSHGEAFLTATSLDAGQDRENIPKTSAMTHEPSPRITYLDGGEGIMQQKLNELIEFCTTLQNQHTQMAAKIQSQDLEISQLKARIKTLEDAQKLRGCDQEDAPNMGG
ncbi:hypothetical protein Tco_0044756 [Tanacetum coccineum]